jgi:hypothetical protein
MRRHVAGGRVLGAENLRGPPVHRGSMCTGEILVDGRPHDWMEKRDRPPGGQDRDFGELVGRLRGCVLLELRDHGYMTEWRAVGEDRRRLSERDGRARESAHPVEDAPGNGRGCDLPDRRPGGG